MSDDNEMELKFSVEKKHLILVRRALQLVICVFAAYLYGVLVDTQT